MKVQYTTDYTDEFGMEFPNGCVTEHAEPVALERIAQGLCKEADPAARLYRYEPLTDPATECVPEHPDANKKTQKK